MTNIEIGDIVNVEIVFYSLKKDGGVLLWKTDKNLSRMAYYEKVLKYYSFSSKKIQSIFYDEFCAINKL